MRQRYAGIGAALCGAALFVGSSAFADPISPTSLLPALDVYIDSAVAGHAAAAACAGPKSPASDAAGWSKGKAMFLATLWANGFPTDFVRTATQRLDASPAASKPDCSDPALKGELGDPSREGWTGAMQRPLQGMDLRLVTQPVAPATWQQAKTLIAKDAAAEKRLLDCVAVSDAGTLPAMVHDWDQMLLRMGSALAAAGLPRDEVAAAISAAEANTLWHRAAPDAEAELRDSCAKDPVWENRLGRLGFVALDGEVEKLLPPVDAGGGK